MARTKKQETARHAGSAQKSTAVNDGEGGRVDTTTGGAEGSDEASSASSNERARRADTGDEAADGPAMPGTEGRQAADRQTTSQQNGNNGDTQRTLEVDDSFYTARET